MDYYDEEKVEGLRNTAVLSVSMGALTLVVWLVLCMLLSSCGGVLVRPVQTVTMTVCDKVSRRKTVCYGTTLEGDNLERFFKENGGQKEEKTKPAKNEPDVLKVEK